jgi:hypothetical protein
MTIKFKKSDIFQENSNLTVFSGRKNSMANIGLNQANYRWDDWENLNQIQIGNQNRNLLFLDREMATDEQNKEIIQKIVDLAVSRGFTSISFNGIRDIEQQNLTNEERISNQNRRCIQSVHDVISYLNSKQHDIKTFTFCSSSDDYFTRVFREEITV